jgi:FdrA protein
MKESYQSCIHDCTQQRFFTPRIGMIPALHTQAYIHNNLYKDSVALMRVAQRLQALPGVVNATLQMGNPANKEILQEAGLLGPDVSSAGPSDIMVVVQARSAAECAQAVAQSQAQLAGTDEVDATGSAAAASVVPTTLTMGLHGLPGINLAQISVPGAYAAAEALKAVKRGLNVFLFSDNVPLQQEVALKQEAVRRGVLVMGPDCGTALLGGVPLGFANAVRRGSIGLVAASGTGLQEVSTQIHRMGAGVSHAIGTGGRDLSAEVGGATMLQGIQLLAQDAATKVIAVVSKPPAPQVAARVMAALVATGKPAVVLFVGGTNDNSNNNSNGTKASTVHVAHTMVDCAALAVKLAGVKRTPQTPYALPPKPRFASSQRYLRALYAGGTFAAEAQALWANAGLKVWSNVALNDALQLAHPRQPSQGHTALDLGDDAFTVGRPHPMIDQAARVERLMQEAADARVRVVVLDVVIGWGAHSNPAAELAPAVVRARSLARKAGRHLAVLGFVCGTEADPQVLSEQEATLRGSGMVLAGNSANAAWLAGEWVR